MKYFKTVLLGLCLGTALFSQAQIPTKPLAWEDVIGWKRITAQTISDNGKWVACQMEPWRGDASVTLYNDLGAEKLRLLRPKVPLFLLRQTLCWLP